MADNRPEILRELPTHDPLDNKSKLYKLSELRREGVEVAPLMVGTEKRGYTFVKIKNECIVDFAIMSEVTSDDDDDEYLEAVWCGSGTGGSLRELRHSWFGEDQDGYIFYCCTNFMKAACDFLQTYFEPEYNVG